MSKINWKLRLQNKTTIVSLITLFVAFLFDALEVCEIVPPVTETFVKDCIEMVVKCIAMVGVVVDPTTKGLTDSDRAMSYNEPN